MKNNNCIKKLIAVLISFLMTMGMSCAETPETAEDLPADSTVSVRRLEGAGYDTPEEAVLAYIDAMNRGNVADMLSTFAVESYIDHMDSELYLEYTKKFRTSYIWDSIPYADEMMRSLAIHHRYGTVAANLLLYYAGDSTIQIINTTEDQELLLNQLSQSVLNQVPENIEFVQWINPAAITEGNLMKKVTKSGDAVGSKAYLNADDMTEIAVHVRIGEKDAVMSLCCVRYGDRWYNLEVGYWTIQYARILSETNVPKPIYIFEENLSEWMEPLNKEYEEECAQWEAIQESDLAGSRWRLVSLSNTDITVHSNTADAENDTGAGVWAEMHFLRLGGLITIVGSPVLQQMLIMDDATARISFPWTAAGITTEYTSINKLKGSSTTKSTFGSLYENDIKLNLDDVTVTQDEDTITITLANGVQAVFVRKSALSVQGTTETLPKYTPYSEQLEGKGYDTPEDAVMAYLDAMNRGDVRDMLSTFAIESYFAHADQMLDVQRRGKFAPMTAAPDYVPCASEFVELLASYDRYSNIAGELLSGYTWYVIETESEIEFSNIDEIQAFQEQYQQSPVYNIQGHVEFVQWVSPVNVTEGRITEPNVRTTMMSDVASTGADDMTELVARIRINGNDAYQTMWCFRYGDRWYNYSVSWMIYGVLQSFSLQQSSGRQMLPLVLSVDGQEKIESRLQADYTEGNALWNAFRTSDLSGSRLKLISVSTPGLTVYEEGNAAKEAEGIGVFAEMHFFSNGGGIITVTASPELQQNLGMDDDTDRILFAWMSESPEHLTAEGYIAYNGDKIQTGLENITVSRDESTVTLTWENGIQAVFQKP